MLFPTTTSPPPPDVGVDPFQTVDPFASQSEIGATTENNNWFQPPSTIENPSTNS